jgi:hypothetical protein
MPFRIFIQCIDDNEHGQEFRNCGVQYGIGLLKGQVRALRAVFAVQPMNVGRYGFLKCKLSPDGSKEIFRRVCLSHSLVIEIKHPDASILVRQVHSKIIIDNYGSVVM